MLVSSVALPCMVFLWVEGIPDRLRCALTGGDEVPTVWVDRMGGKVSLHETYSRNSKGTVGVVMQEVATRDDSGGLCTHCTRQLPMGQMAGQGPPTTLSDTGIDRSMYLQGNITRDTTYFVNGAVVGSRDIFQVRSVC